MLLHSTQFAILLILAKTTFASINTTIQDVSNKLDVEAINKKLGAVVDTRRAAKERSTSSSSGEKKSSGKESGTSFSFSSESDDTDEKQKSKKKGNQPQSSAERKGWRKWHRKCPKCPEEMRMKWRDPQIKWICGAYQRARRSFKSLCMMHFRNCQDGTMFVKIADHRCPDDIPKDSQPHGDHFFYEYQVALEDESSKSSRSSDQEDTEDSSEDIYDI